MLSITYEIHITDVGVVCFHCCVSISFYKCITSYILLLMDIWVVSNFALLLVNTAATSISIHVSINMDTHFCWIYAKFWTYLHIDLHISSFHRLCKTIFQCNYSIWNFYQQLYMNSTYFIPSPTLVPGHLINFRFSNLYVGLLYFLF